MVIQLLLTVIYVFRPLSMPVDHSRSTSHQSIFWSSESRNSLWSCTLVLLLLLPWCQDLCPFAGTAEIKFRWYKLQQFKTLLASRPSFKFKFFGTFTGLIILFAACQLHAYFSTSPRHADEEMEPRAEEG